MIRFLTDHPTVLMVLNCCVGPAVAVLIGYLIGRYRPRLRVPFTLDRSERSESEF